MASLSEIYSFLSEVSGIRIDRFKPDADLFDDLGIDGDDFFALEDEFARRFAVDMSTYRWYFHHGEEGGPSIGRFLFKPPYARVKRLPITPELLLASANAGRWRISYPEHHLPSHRIDFIIDRFILGAAGVASVFFVGWKLVDV